VEIACHGGVAELAPHWACLAVLDGVPAREAVAYVREHYPPAGRRDVLAALRRHPPRYVVGRPRKRNRLR